MDFDISELLEQATSVAAFLLLYLAVVVLAKWVKDKTTRFSIDEQITKEQNLAVAVTYFGYMLSISIVYIGAMLGPSEGLLVDLVKVLSYSALGIVLLNVSRFINDKFILHQFNNYKEIIEDKNAGTGAVQAGSHVASAMIIAASIHGQGGDMTTAVVFFIVCQVAMVLMTLAYNFVTPFNIHDEIEKDNVAAGIALAGSLIAVGAILAKGAAGNFLSWQHNLTVMAEYCVVAFFLIPLFRVILDKIMIRGIDLNKEIATHSNVGAGLVEFSGVIGFSIVVYFLV